MASLDLNELERLEKAATPGPWVLHKHSETSVVGSEYVVAACGGYSTNARDPEELHAELCGNAALIAAMRNAIPELLRRLRAAEADRIAHERAAHEADLRTQAAVRAEKDAQSRIAELEKENADQQHDIERLLESLNAEINARKP